MRAAWLAPLLCLATACGGGGASRSDAPRGPRVDLGRASADAAALVNEIYGDLRRGYLDGLQNVTAPAVLVLGPGGEVFTDRTAVVLAMGRGFPRKKHKLRSRGLEVVAAPGGKSARVTDSLDLDGQRLRLSAVLVSEDGIWTVAALHLSRPVADALPTATASAPAGKPQLPPATGAAADLAELVRTWSKPGAVLDQFAPRDDIQLFGPGARDSAAGPRAIARWWKKNRQSAPMAPTPFNAGLTPDGALGWVAADIQVDGSPERHFAIFIRKGKSYRLLVSHAATR
ncbi:MAG: nuclear transport factor 2 family protein [Deltaproteobacteria bacterium]|nr:nuclear transport factor 2 family protein [Deltaproteobacteria bacterium]